jgi:putative OPT family oligopeptide transporter
LLFSAGVLLLLGMTGTKGVLAALGVAGVVCCAAATAGDTSQDLKTGYLVGATPWKQQLGELIGVLTSAAFVCLVVANLDEAYRFGSDALPAPQATLMRLVIDGVLEQSLPIGLVGIGAGLAILAEFFRVPSLPFAVGLYLPVSTMVPVFLGGMLRYVLEARASVPESVESRRTAGMLFGSGMVGGEGLVGVAVAGWAVANGAAPVGIGPEWAGDFAPYAATLAFALLFAINARVAVARAG